MSKPYFDGVYNSSDEQEDESAYNYESEPSSNEEDEQENDVKMRRRRHIEEQGEEEKNAEDLIKKMKLFGSDAKGLYMLNQELAARTYAAPVNAPAM